MHRAQADQGEDVGHALFSFSCRQVVDPKRHILCSIHVRKQRVVLKHHANAALFGRYVVAGAADNLVPQADVAGLRSFQTSHRAQQRGFAAARRADQHPNLPGLQRERHAIDRRPGAACVVNTKLGDV